MSELKQLHYASSRLTQKRFLPAPLLDSLCDCLKPLGPGYLEPSVTALNALRDALPPEAFIEPPRALLYEHRRIALMSLYPAFAAAFRGKTTEEMYPPYYLDFDEPEPKFYDDEPLETVRKVEWRNDKRRFLDFEICRLERTPAPV
jgi:hypothetical protein